MPYGEHLAIKGGTNMSWNPFSKNKVSEMPYTIYGPGVGYEKKSRLSTIIKWSAVILVSIGIIALGIRFLFVKSTQDKSLEQATTAASKHTPDAQVSNVKVSGGYAMAVVSNPNTNTQASAGNTTIFKVNKDGSMTQIANASYFSPIDLLTLGIPLSTQAALTGSSVSQVQQTLAGLCNYDGGDTPGYRGFDGSFKPGGWQIDSATLNNLEQALTDTITSKNAGVSNDKKIICVNATQNNSNAQTDLQTYISTFTLEIQFITYDGTLTTHTVNFSIGPRGYHSYTLDGQSIQATTTAQ